MPSVLKRVTKYNENRLPEYTALKMHVMTEDVFRFFRGTCHLYYEDLSRDINWKDPTKVWICGDLHLENFGSYKGNNGIVYFDINDFDESIQAPLTWELSRFLTSIYIGADVVGYDTDTADKLIRQALEAYLRVLKQGKALIVEQQSATGLLQFFLDQVAQRKETAFLKTRVSFSKKQIRLIIDNKKTFPLKDKIRAKVVKSVRKWFHDTMPDKEVDILDVAFRVAGTGSVGLCRYIVLLKMGAKIHLLDVKEAAPSSLQPYVTLKQPIWHNEGIRITSLQDRIQQVSPRMLSHVNIDKKTFVLKTLQPSQDRMDMRLCKGRVPELESIINTMAQLSASGHLRNTGRQHSSITDDLIEFAGDSRNWQAPLLAYVKQYALKMRSYYDSYSTDYKVLNKSSIDIKRSIR